MSDTFGIDKVKGDRCVTGPVQEDPGENRAIEFAIETSGESHTG